MTAAHGPGDGGPGAGTRPSQAGLATRSDLWLQGRFLRASSWAVRPRPRPGAARPQGRGDPTPTHQPPPARTRPGQPFQKAGRTGTYLSRGRERLRLTSPERGALGSSPPESGVRSARPPHVHPRRAHTCPCPGRDGQSLHKSGHQPSGMARETGWERGGRAGRSATTRAALQGLIQGQASGSLIGCVCHVERTHRVSLRSPDLALWCLHRGREPCSLSACCSPGCPRVTAPGQTYWAARDSLRAERGPC